MRKLTILLIAVLGSITSVIAQNNTGIGTSTPEQSAILDASSLDKGFLMPRMTGAQIAAIVNPVAGLVVYNTDANHFTYYNGNTWKNFSLLSVVTKMINVGLVSPTPVPTSTSDYVEVGGLNQTLVLDESSKVVVNTNVIAKSANTTSNASSTIAVFVDGQIVNSSMRNVDAIVVNGISVSSSVQMVSLIDLPVGSHSISIRVKYRSGDSTVLNDGNLNIRVIN